MIWAIVGLIVFAGLAATAITNDICDENGFAGTVTDAVKRWFKA